MIWVLLASMLMQSPKDYLVPLPPCHGVMACQSDTDDDDTAEDVPDAPLEDCIPQVVIVDGRPQTFCITPDEANQNENWIGYYVETHCHPWLYQVVKDHMLESETWRIKCDK